MGEIGLRPTAFDSQRLNSVGVYVQVSPSQGKPVASILGQMPREGYGSDPIFARQVADTCTTVGLLASVSRPSDRSSRRSSGPRIAGWERRLSLASRAEITHVSLTRKFASRSRQFGTPGRACTLGYSRPSDTRISVR